jgi:hypothetical protein
MHGMDRLSESFDSVPHSWIITSLELIGINGKVITHTKKTLSYWKTSKRLYTEEKVIKQKIEKYSVKYSKNTQYHHCYFALA